MRLSSIRIFRWCLALALLAIQLSDVSAAQAVSEKIHDTGAEKAIPSGFTSEELAHLLNTMVWVDGGPFIMGSNSANSSNMERPAHRVTVSGFYLAKTEVTQALFKRVMGWNYSYFPCESCPINNISWMNMQLFIERLNLLSGKNFRLPTEAEWEYGAKGGQKSEGYRYSGSNDISEVAWYSDNAERRSHPVGLKKPNELGIYDMTGNLWEFCQDDISRTAYKQHARIDPVVISNPDYKVTSMKVIRGGAYEFSESESEVFKRDGATNNVRMADIGFRLAMSKD